MSVRWCKCLEPDADMAQTTRGPNGVEENLMLAQVVYQFGISDWQRISSTLVERSNERGKPVMWNAVVSLLCAVMHCLTPLEGVSGSLGANACRTCDRHPVRHSVEHQRNKLTITSVDATRRDRFMLPFGMSHFSGLGYAFDIRWQPQKTWLLLEPFSTGNTKRPISIYS